MWEKYLKKIPEMVKQIKAIWALPEETWEHKALAIAEVLGGDIGEEEK